MSDWTKSDIPTTFKVAGYSETEMDKVAEKYFYSGFNAGLTHAIKLVEELAFQINSVEHNPTEAEGAYRASALIKGEQK